MTAAFESPAALLTGAGTDLGVSDWIDIDQRRIDEFADATDDHQWIHVDPHKAAHGPFGGTIAHGYLTLSLLVRMTGELLHVGSTALVINAGSDRVRFLAPVPAGSRIRARGVLAAAEQVPAGVRAKVAVTVDIDGADKPALVAEALLIYVPDIASAGPKSEEES